MKTRNYSPNRTIKLILPMQQMKHLDENNNALCNELIKTCKFKSNQIKHYIQVLNNTYRYIACSLKYMICLRKGTNI